MLEAAFDGEWIEGTVLCNGLELGVTVVRAGWAPGTPSAVALAQHAGGLGLAGEL